jgi:hypothetical protein
MFQDSNIVHGDIVHTRHVYYSPVNRIFTKTIEPHDVSKNIIHIQNPVFSIETLHFCYIHMIENIFRYYWILQDLLESKELQTDNVTFFIRRNDLMAYATLNDYILAQYFSVIDVKKNCYRGAWNDVFKIINKNDIIFESFIINDCLYFFEDIYVFTNDEHQHSFWNTKFSDPWRILSTDYFNSHRHLFPYVYTINGESVYARYSDETIKEKLFSFRKKILDTYLPTYDVPWEGKRKAILINRRDSRVFPVSVLQELTEYLKSSTKIQYNGMYFLEDMNFQEQLQLFNTNDVFFMVHGAGCANILWAKKNSVLFQYDNVENRFCMYNRLASLLDIIPYNILLGVNHFPHLLDSIPL